MILLGDEADRWLEFEAAESKYSKGYARGELLFTMRRPHVCSELDLVGQKYENTHYHWRKKCARIEP